MQVVELKANGLKKLSHEWNTEFVRMNVDSVTLEYITRVYT